MKFILLKELMKESAPSDMTDEQETKILTAMEKTIKKLHPHVHTVIEKAETGTPDYHVPMKLFVNTYETQFGIGIVPRSRGKLFYVEAVWPEDEKGKNRLDARQTLRAIETIPGMKGY